MTRQMAFHLALHMIDKMTPIELERAIKALKKLAPTNPEG